MSELPTKPPTKRRRIMMNEEEAQTRAAMWEEAARAYRDASSGKDIPAQEVPLDRSSITMGRHLEDLRAVDLRIRVIEGAVIELATFMGISAETLEKGKKPRSSWEAVSTSGDRNERSDKDTENAPE